MSSPNHCQNLWMQFAKVDQAQKSCAGLVDLVNKEGNESLSDLADRVSGLEDDLRRMKELWDSSFATLGDGRILFGPEYEVLKELIELSDEDEKHFIARRKRVGITDNRIFFLNLNGANIGDFSALSRLLMLKALQIDRTKDISTLGPMPNLRELTLNDSRITDFSPVSNLRDLEELHLGGIGDVDLGTLTRLTKLRRLYVDKSKITDFSFLEGLTSLSYIGLQDTKFSDSDLSYVENLTNLRGLSLEGTNISSISSLANLTKLQSLNICRTKVKEIAAVANMPDLDALDMISTAVRDISPVMGLQKLRWLNIKGSPISKKSSNVIELIQRGVSVI